MATVIAIKGLNMSKVLVTESYLTAIGDAIRSKNSSTTKYKPSEMAAAIKNIKTQDNTAVNSIIDRTISGDYTNNGATSVGKYAFAFCVNLKTVTMTNATDINSNAFYDCTGLISANFPNVKTVSSSAFNSSGLTSITFNNLVKLGSNSDYSGIFENTPMTSISIPSTIKTIGLYAFSYSSIKTIIVNRKKDAISGAPWGATGATVNWTGRT